MELQMNNQNTSVFGMLRQKHYKAENEESTQYLNLDNDMQGLISKLNKKSEKTLHTRIKAFGQIYDKLQGKSNEYLEQFFKIYLMIFDFVSFAEKNKEILMKNQNVVELLVTKNPKLIKKNFKQIFPLLFFSCFHHIEEVAQKAKENLQILIKSDQNLAKAFSFYHEEYIEKISPYLNQNYEYMKDISIYQNDETDKIIFNNDRSSVLRSISKAINLTQYLEQDQKNLIFLKIANFLGMPNQNKKKKNLLFILFEESKFDYLLKFGVVQIFNEIFKTQNEENIKSEQKKIIEFFLLQHLDEPTQFVQQIFWKDEFIIDLIQKSKQIKFNISGIESKLQNLITNFGFGAGDSYYQQLPKIFFMIFDGKNWNTSQNKIFKLLQLHMQTLNQNNVNIDVDKHIKVSFEILDYFYINTKDNDVKKDLVEKIIPEFLMYCFQQYLLENNPKQRNLLVLNVNNNKKIPLLMIQYLIKLFNYQNMKISSEIFKNLFIKNLSEQQSMYLVNEISIANFSIFIQFLLQQSDCLLIEQIFENTLNQFINHFEQYFEENLIDANFDEKNKFNNYFLFFNEIYSLKNIKFDFEKNQNLSKIYKEISQKLQSIYEKQILNQELQKKIWIPQNNIKINFILSQILKLTTQFIYPQKIINQYISKFDENSIDKETLYSSLFILFTFTNNLKLLEQILIDKNINSIQELTQKPLPIKKNKFYEYIMTSDEGKLILNQIMDFYFSKKKIIFAPILIHLMQIHNDFKNDLIQNWNNFISEFIGEEQFLQSQLIFLKKCLEICQVEDFQKISKGINNIFIQSQDLYFNELQETMDNLSLKSKINLIKGFTYNIFQIKYNKFYLEFLINFIDDYFTDNENNEIYTLTPYLSNLYLEQTHDLESQKIYQKLLQPIYHQKSIQKFLQEQISSMNKNLIYIYEQPFVTVNFLDLHLSNFWIRKILNDFLEVINVHLEEDPENFKNFLKLITQQAQNNQKLQSLIQKMIRLIGNKSEIDQDDKIILINIIIHILVQNDNNDFQNFLMFEKLVEEIPEHLILEFWETFLKIDHKNNNYFSKEIYQIQKFIFEKNKDINKLKENLTQEQDESLFNEQIQKLFDLKLSQYEEGYIFMKFLDLILKKNYQGLIVQHLDKIIQIFEQILNKNQEQFQEKYSINSFYQLLRLLKKLINFIEIFPESISKNLSSNVITLNLYFIKNIHMLDNTGINIENFIQESSEVITRFGLQEQSLDIDGILKMIQLKINSLKKSSFYLLRSIQDPFSISEEQIQKIMQMQNIENKEENQSLQIIEKMPEQLQLLLTQPENYDNFTYFIIWNYLLNQISGFSDQSQLNYKILLILFDSEKKYFHNIMNKLFKFFQMKNYKQNTLLQLQKKLDYQHPEEKWEDFLTEEVEENFAFKLILQFLGLFPKSYNEWSILKSKLTNVSSLIIKTGMYDKIFDFEMDQIELSQHFWKEENFNMQIYRKSRQIKIFYCYDQFNLEYELEIPQLYPKENIIVQSLNKDFKKDFILKVNLVKVINDHSLNLISGIMKWKKYVDLHFEGYDTCTICYYIVDQTTGEFPKEACCNCGKKFHKNCVNQWFKTAQRAECPLCKQNFRHQ